MNKSYVKEYVEDIQKRDNKITSGKQFYKKGYLFIWQYVEEYCY